MASGKPVWQHLNEGQHSLNSICSFKNPWTRYPRSLNARFPSAGKFMSLELLLWTFECSLLPDNTSTFLPLKLLTIHTHQFLFDNPQPCCRHFFEKSVLKTIWAYTHFSKWRTFSLSESWKNPRVSHKDWMAISVLWSLRLLKVFVRLITTSSWRWRNVCADTASSQPGSDSSRTCFRRPSGQELHV